jgi:hypothetical protein
MTLDNEDIEQIARRVAELVGSTQIDSDPRYVTAARLAQMLSVDREWVYQHARRLGAVRLDGPSSRLRFDVRRVVEAFSPPDLEARPRRRASSQRGGAVGSVELIQYER